MHEQEQIPWMPLASIFIAPNLKNHYRRGEHQRHGPAARSLLVVFTGLDRARVPNVQPSALTPALHSAAAQCACVPLPLLHVLTKQFEQMDRLFSEIRQVFFGSCANKYYIPLCLYVVMQLQLGHHGSDCWALHLLVGAACSTA